MPKKPRKHHRHKDVSNHKHHSSHHKHSSKTRKHHHKRTAENALDTIHEVSKEKIPIDSKACGDHNTSADITKKDIDVRHQSLEQHGSNLLSKTRNFFRREKSLNDCPDRNKPTNDTIIIQVKEKDKTHKKSQGHKKIVSNVQEVIFCQMHQIPHEAKVDKNGSEVKDIYRRLKKDRKTHKTNHDIDKNKQSVKNDSYHSHQINKTHVHEHKHRKRHADDHIEKSEATSNKKDHVRDERKANGPCEKDQIATKHPNGRHRAGAEESSTRKRRKDQPPSTDKPQDHPPTLKEDEIRKIIEGNMTNYFTKFQSIIDKKLDCLMQCHKKNDDRKSDKREKQVSKEDGLKYRDEIVKEVLKKIKREEKEIKRKKGAVKEQKQKVNEETQAAPIKQPKPPRSPHTASTAANDFYLNEYLFKKHYISPMDCRSFSEYKLLPAMDSITSHKKRLRNSTEKSTGNQDLSALMRHMKENHKKSHSKRSYNELVTLTDDQLSIQPHCIYKEATKLISLPKLEEDVKKSHRNSEEILIQGVEPPSSDAPKRYKPKAKRFECKTMSIVRIWPKKESAKSPLPHQSNQFHIDLVERKKTSKRFKLYYKYSLRHQIKHDPISSTSDGKSTVSDSCKDVLDPSDASVEMYPIKNSQRSKPMKLHECYFNPITSSHSEYCFDISKHQTRSTPTSYKKNSLHRSQSTLPPENKIKPQPTKPKTSQRCQTSICYIETKPDFKEIYKTLDDLEDNLQKCGLTCPEMRSVSVNATPPSTESVENTNIIDKPKSKDVLKRVDASIGSGDLKEYEKNKKSTRDVAVEVSMESRIPSSSKNKRVRSVGVSPIRIIGEKDDKPNKTVAEQNHPMKKAQTPKTSKSPPTCSPFRKTVLQPVHNKPFSFQHVVSPQVVLVHDKYNISPKEIKSSKPISRLSNRTHSSSKDRPKSKTIEVKSKPEKPAVSPRTERNACSNQAAKTSCDLHVMDKNHKTHEGSTSSSVSDALDGMARKSKSLTHIKSKKENENRPKSTVCCLKPVPVTNNHSSRGGSFISNNLEKFLNKPPINHTNTDHCIESKLTGRLLLTKSFKEGEVSAYQKRKLYDQSIRQRMKRKFKLSKMNVGPQVFEVRFLSMMEPGSVQGDSPVQKQVFSFNFDRLQAEIKSDEAKSTKTDGDLDVNVGESSKCDAIVDEKFLKWCQKLLNMTDNAELRQSESTQCSCSEYSENCTACKEFVGFLDVLYKSMVSYRNSVDSTKTHQTGDLEEVFPGQFGCSRSFSCQSFDISDTVDKTIRLSQPASCPMLMSNSSSFEFLYEEAPLMQLNLDAKETVLRQFDQTFHFSMSQYNVETPSPPEKKCYTSASATESGYSSVRSKGNSTSNFFKRANILALLKPRKNPQTQPSGNQIEDEYKKMSETCQMYGKKVIENSSSRQKLQIHNYEELPLNTILCKGEPVLDEKPSTTTKEEIDILPNGCKIIINNNVLKLNTIFYIMGNVLRDVNIRDCSSFRSKSDTDGFSSKTEGDLSLDRIESSTVSMVKSFVSALLESYDRETELCRRLLDNQEFLQGVLVPAAEHRIKTDRRNKKGKLRGLFTKNHSESFNSNTVEAQMSTDHIQAVKKLQEFARHAKKDFIMLAQAARINENIDNDIKICGMLRLLERIENGEFHLEQVNVDFDFEAEVVANVVDSFAAISAITDREMKKMKKNIRPPIDIDLINLMVTKYRIALLVRTNVIPVYISRKLIQTEQQLKAAVSYLMRTSETETSIADFEDSIETARRPPIDEDAVPSSS